MLIEVIAKSQNDINYYSVYEFYLDDIICVERKLRNYNKKIEDNIVYYIIHLKSGLKIFDISKEDYDRITLLRQSLLRNNKINSILES